MRSRATVQSPAAWWRGRNQSTAAEIAALVSPANQNVPAYERGRYASWGDWAKACDEAGAEGVLDGDYVITADILLPKKCDFRGYKITGAFFATHAFHWGGWVKGFRAQKPRIRGTYFCEYTQCATTHFIGKMVVDGGDGVSPTTGCFWNKIGIELVDQLELNADHFDVNFNTFWGGIARFVHLTGGAGNAGGIHANVFMMVDMSDYPAPDAMTPSCGYLQDDEKRYKNFILGCYYENGSQIRGNVKIENYQGDASGMPLTDRGNHVMGTTGINARLANDFLALTPRNLARGGCWDWLDSSGKPPCVAHSGGTSVAVTVDTSEPGGTGKRYAATFASAFSNFSIEVQPGGTEHTGVVIFYKSSASFVTVQSNFTGSGGATSFDTEPVVVSGDWKMLRLSCPSSPTDVLNITLFAYGGVGGAAKVMSIGSVWAGSELAVMHPARNDEYSSVEGARHSIGGELVQHGSAPQSYVAATPVDIAVVFPVAFAAVPNVVFSIEATSANTPHFVKAYIKSGTLTAAGFTVRVEYSSDWDGSVHWIAMGRRV